MSGIYIQGMEMPESCDKCFVKFCEGRAKEERISVQRHESCPLVPVPLHGRLIDSDVLIERIIVKYIHYERNKDVVFSVDEIKQHMADIINALPTIIPASEKE